MMKTLLTAAALTVLPGLALAMGCSGHKHEQTVMSCVEGTVYDVESGTCVPVVTG